jgi:GNAT superfamily N-acetyltransferase
MNIEFVPVELSEIAPLRDLYRHEANCQVIHYSFLTRGLADPWRIAVDGRLAGYGAIDNKYNKGCLIEFYVLPTYREIALPLCRELLLRSQATHIEAQTNIPLALQALNHFATDIAAEKLLFYDALTTYLTGPPDAEFRRALPQESQPIFAHQHEPVGDWVIEATDKIIATGGFLTHYNPPYADLFMEVEKPARLHGYGSYLIQELKRACYEAGKKPAARTDPSNIASRRTLEKAGMHPCAELRIGKIKPQP